MFALMAMCLWRAWPREKDLFLGLLVGVGFAFLGEYLATVVTKEYYYGEFLINILCLPLGDLVGNGPRPLTCEPGFSCIPLPVPIMESLVAYAALRTVRRLRLPPVAAGLYCGLLALCIDLAIDPIVSQSKYCPVLPAMAELPWEGEHGVGLGFWVWMITSPEIATLGVINNNYAGWFLGVMSLSMALQWMNQAFDLDHQGWRCNLIVGLLCVPVMALLLFMATFWLYYLVSKYLHVPYGDSLSFIVIVSALVIISKRRSMHFKNSLDWVALFVPAFLCLFAFTAMVLLRMYVEPGLAARWTWASFAGGSLFLLPSLRVLLPLREVVIRPESS